MKKISLSIFVALLAAMVAVPASAAKITVDGLYTNDWTYKDGDINPNNLFENQKLELNLTITEGDMFKAYLPLEFKTDKVLKENEKWALGVGMDSDWYIAFTSENASAWASQNDADGYEFEAFKDPLGIGKNIKGSSLTSLSNNTGMLENIGQTPKLSVDLNLLLKGEFKFGPVSLMSYVADNTLNKGEGNAKTGDGDFIVNINRLTVDLPYGIDLGVTASYTTKSYIKDKNGIQLPATSTDMPDGKVTVYDKFSQLTLSADASYDLPIANVGGKITVAGAMMFQREGYPNAATEKTKMKYVKDSLGLFIGATDFKLGPVTLGLDFSLAQSNALSVTATYPSVPSKWASRWSLAADDHLYYITDSTSRYLPNTMILNANVGSDFNIGSVGLEIKLNNKLNMALKDVEENKDNFSRIVSNITTLNSTLGITDDISLKLGTIVDYRIAELYTGLKLKDSFPVVQGSIGTEFSALKLNVDAVVRYYGANYNDKDDVFHGKPIEAVLWASFNRPFALTSNISLTPTVAGAFGVHNKATSEAENSERATGLGGLAFVGVETEISKISVDGGYLLVADKKAGENEKATVNHIAHIGAGVKLSSIFSLNAGYTFRTDLDPLADGQEANKDKRHFVSADLTAQVSEDTKLVLSYGETGLATSKTLKSFNNAGSFNSNKPWTKIGRAHV